MCIAIHHISAIHCISVWKELAVSCRCKVCKPQHESRPIPRFERIISYNKSLKATAGSFRSLEASVPDHLAPPACNVNERVAAGTTGKRHFCVLESINHVRPMFDPACAGVFSAESWIQGEFHLSLSITDNRVILEYISERSTIN